MPVIILYIRILSNQSSFYNLSQLLQCMSKVLHYNNFHLTIWPLIHGHLIITSKNSENASLNFYKSSHKIFSIVTLTACLEIKLSLHVEGRVTHLKSPAQSHSSTSQARSLVRLPRFCDSNSNILTNTT